MLLNMTQIVQAALANKLHNTSQVNLRPPRFVHTLVSFYSVKSSHVNLRFTRTKNLVVEIPPVLVPKVFASLPPVSAKGSNYIASGRVLVSYHIMVPPPLNLHSYYSKVPFVGPKGQKQPLR